MPFHFNSLLDTEFLQALYADDYQYAEEVFGNFLKQTRPALKQLEQLIESGTVAPFRALLHKIKPTFSLVGLSNLTLESEKLLTVCDQSPDIIIIRPQYQLWQLMVDQWLPYAEEEYLRLKRFNEQ